jgi:hypothetical protein
MESCSQRKSLSTFSLALSVPAKTGRLSPQAPKSFLTEVISEKKSYDQQCEGYCPYRASGSSSFDLRFEEITVRLIIALVSSAAERALV